jgi:lariat debranching enzyme
MSVPQKYRAIGDFHEYYSGKRIAPFLTIFIGGNHEASNHLFELYYGGWVAPNIYYMGAANVLRCGPLRIAGMSGIWKGYDFRKPHFERLPYNRDDIQSIYHVRELDVRKLLQIRTQVDLGLSHDWPKKVEYSGNYEQLFRVKNGFREDSQRGHLGSTAARYVLDRLRPRYWFSAHLHVKFTGSVAHDKYGAPENEQSHDQGSVQENSPKVPYSYGLDGPLVSVESGPLYHDSGLGSALAETVPDLPDAMSVTGENGQDKAVPKPSLSLGSQSLSGVPQVTAKNAIGSSSIQSNKVNPPSLSAWQNFHAVAARQEAQDYQRYLHEMKENQEAHVTAPEAAHQLTWRKVNIGEDMLSRKVTGVRKTGFTEESESKRPKTEHTTGVKNSDEINLDLSSDAGSPPQNNAATDATGEQKDTAPKGGVSFNAEANTPSAGGQSSKPDGDESISQDLRQQLPASFQQPVPTSSASYPVPEAISNKTTQFLALDKCLPGRNFLELVEFSAISDQDNVQQGRPFRLQYDKEWLAITRVFADDLKVGDPTATVPVDQGEQYYKERIMQEEQWVEEHVVKAGKMAVPDNFTITAAPYDASVPITTQDMPQEYNNPQTAAFCDLIGIQNKFHLTDAERQALVAAGPRPATQRHRGRGNNRFAQRGGGRGWHGGGGSRGGANPGRGGGRPQSNAAW